MKITSIHLSMLALDDMILITPDYRSGAFEVDEEPQFLILKRNWRTVETVLAKRQLAFQIKDRPGTYQVVGVLSDGSQLKSNKLRVSKAMLRALPGRDAPR